MYVAHYAADNQYEEFETFEEAKKWLEDFWLEDAGEEGYSEETINNRDFIAKITHQSKFIEIGNKQRDGFVWNEEEYVSINKDGEMWPVSEDFDFYGDVILEKIED